MSCAYQMTDDRRKRQLSFFCSMNRNMIRSQFFSDLSSINLKAKSFLVNRYAKANFRKQEICFKIWTILGIDNNYMEDELFFYGIDAGFINEEEAKVRKSKVCLGRKSVPKNLPETGEVVEIDDKYKENNWELFRVKRRCVSVTSNTGYLWRDDVERLKTEMGKKECDVKEMMKESAYFGSIKCFKQLIINGAEPSEETIAGACYSGNEEMIQTLREKGMKFSKECLDSAILGWNNSLARWMIENEGIETSLHSAAESSNYAMIVYLIERGADINARTNICQITFH